MPPSRPPQERFLEKIDYDGPIPRHCPELGKCWLWTARCTGRKRPGGSQHGSFAVRHGVPVYAHRFAYELYYGPIPYGVCVLHRCDNPICVNYAHLKLGTQRDNIDDMVHKGRSTKGDKNPSRLHPDLLKTKLTLAQVAEIRLRYRPRVVTQKALALEFGVSVNTVQAILSRKTWSWAT